MPSSNSWIKTSEEIKTLAEGGKKLAHILDRVAKMVRPGISTWELNVAAEQGIADVGGTPSFKGYGPAKNTFPAGLCTSINSVVVHGVPSKKDILKEGDIVSLDIGMEYKGLFTDMAITVGVGRISIEARKLLDATRLSLVAAIKQAKAGNRIGDIASATQKVAEKNGYNVVRDLVGHGVGYEVHEDPQVPGYGKPRIGPVLESGMVLAIEPMVVEGSHKLVIEPDGWSISTRDGGLAAHFEHTIAVGPKGAQILTA